MSPPIACCRSAWFIPMAINDRNRLSFFISISSFLFLFVVLHYRICNFYESKKIEGVKKIAPVDVTGALVFLYKSSLNLINIEIDLNRFDKRIWHWLIAFGMRQNRNLSHDRNHSIVQGLTRKSSFHNIHRYM